MPSCLYRPAWSNNTGPLEHAEALPQTLQGAESEGLRPRDYHLLPIVDALAAVRQGQNIPASWRSSRLADLALLFTDAFLTYNAHLLHGRQHLETMDAGGLATDEDIDLVRLLHRALATERIAETLHSLLPLSAEYVRLGQALAQYRRLAAHGGWPTLAAGLSLRQGDQDERVVALRHRRTARSTFAPIFMATIRPRRWPSRKNLLRHAGKTTGVPSLSLETGTHYRIEPFTAIRMWMQVWNLQTERAAVGNAYTYTGS